MTHWKRPWCWERLRAGGEREDRGLDGCMASSTGWTWVWVDSGSWWWTGGPGVLQFMGSQRVGHDWATEVNWTEASLKVEIFNMFFFYKWKYLRSINAKRISQESEVAQSCPTLCDPMDCSLSGSSVHGIFQARVLEWIAISFSRESSWPRDRTWVSHIAGRHFTVWATREVNFSRPSVN